MQPWQTAHHQPKRAKRDVDQDNGAQLDAEIERLPATNLEAEHRDQPQEAAHIHHDGDGLLREKRLPGKDWPRWSRHDGRRGGDGDRRRRWRGGCRPHCYRRGCRRGGGCGGSGAFGGGGGANGEVACAIVVAQRGDRLFTLATGDTGIEVIQRAIEPL